MLSRLIGYDMRALARVLGPIEAIALAVGALAGGCGALGYWVNEISALPSSISGLLEVLAFSVLGIGAMGIACLIPATLVIVLHRFYTNLFTDQGYLTFTLPVRASDIL